MSLIPPDNDTFIQELLQQRDDLYALVSRYQKADSGALDILEKENKEKDTIIKEQSERIEKLLDQLAWYKRKMWNPSKERFIPEDPNQRRIDWEGLDLLPEEEEIAKEADKELIAYERRKPQKEKNKAVRQPIPEDLRREEEVIEPEGINENWVRIGEEVTEVLEFKPGELYVRKIIRPKYAAKSTVELSEGESRISIASLPVLPLLRSNADASILAEIIMNKYLYHLPFHRQIAMFKQLGLTISSSTINGWFKDVSDILRALYQKLGSLIKTCDYIQVDESTVPVINDEKHRAVKAYLWVVRSVMNDLVYFHYDRGSRAQKVVVELLHDYKGAIQTDGYEAYSIYEQKKGILLLGCWAHVRRKFVESEKEDKAGSQYALAQIAKLYQVESMADEQQLNYEQRAELRKRLAYPIMVAFEKWIVNYYPKVLPNGRMGRALKYAYNIFPRLTRYHLDGRYRLDNNLAENAIRPLSLGRKNFMFCGNHDAAENAAIMYSLIGSCKASGVDVREWLIDVLTVLPLYNNDYSKDLEDLLPHNWKNSKKY